jgi:transposase
VLRQKWSHSQAEARLANMQPCLIGMDACVGAHHLSRKLEALGHDARLMAVKYVRPYSARKINRNNLRRELYLVPFAVQLKDAPNTFAVRCRAPNSWFARREHGARLTPRHLAWRSSGC